MSNIKRRVIEEAPTPVNWSEVSVGGLVIYREARDKQTGTEQVDKPVENASGEFLFSDPSDVGTGYFADGSEPEGWVKSTRPTNVPVMTPSRGELRRVEIHEEDADGKVINRNTEGYAPFSTFNTAELQELAMENPEVVGAAFQKTVAALQELAEAIYVTVK